MTHREIKLYSDASEIVRATLGSLVCDRDPLAWWCGVEAIVDAAKRYAGRDRSITPPERTTP